MDIFSLSLFSLCFLSFSLFTGHRVLCVFFSLSLFFLFFFSYFQPRDKLLTWQFTHTQTHPFIYNTSFWHPCFNACVHFTPLWHFFVSDWTLQRFAGPKSKTQKQNPIWKCIHTRPVLKSAFYELRCHKTLFKVIKEIGAFLVSIRFVTYNWNSCVSLAERRIAN